MNLSLYILRWICTLAVAFLAGKLITKLRMPSILGWLITGMLLGPNAAGLLPQEVMNSEWYKLIITWMQCAFGLMLGTELIWAKIKAYGKALIVTTLTQSLGTFAFVSFLLPLYSRSPEYPSIWHLHSEASPLQQLLHLHFLSYRNSTHTEP